MFFKLKKKMIKSDIPNPPIWEMFMMFFTYGGLLTLLLTAFFWYWSGAASLGIFYLIFIAPIIMLIIAYRLYYKMKTSIYHEWMFYLGIVYFVVAPVVLYAAYLNADS